MSSLKYRINSMDEVNQGSLTKLAASLKERIKALDATFLTMTKDDAGLAIRPYSRYGINTDATVHFEYNRDDVLTQKFIELLGEERAQVAEQLELVQAQLTLLNQVVAGSFLALGRDH